MHEQNKCWQDPVAPAAGCIAWPGACHWGDGALGRAIASAGSRLRHALVVTDADVWRAVGPAVQHALQQAPGLQWHLYDGGSPNPSLVQVREALRLAQGNACTSVIAVGGGSAIDTAKLVFASLASGLEVDDFAAAPGQAWLAAAALPEDPLFLAVPTTAGTGSESSSAALIQDDTGRKRLYRSLRTRPAIVALDPQLTLSLPARATAQGGFDALLHALGAWVNTDPSPVGKAMAMHALRLCLRAYPLMLDTPDSLPARAEMQMGAYLAGVAIGMSKVDAVHAMCTPLEARVHMAHAEVLAPVFSVVARHTVQTHPCAYAEAARMLGVAHADDDISAALALIEAIEALARRAGIAARFADLRLTPEDAGQLAAQALQSASLPLNPRALAPEEIKSLYLQMAT